MPTPTYFQPRRCILVCGENIFSECEDPVFIEKVPTDETYTDDSELMSNDIVYAVIDKTGIVVSPDRKFKIEEKLLEIQRLIENP